MASNVESSIEKGCDVIYDFSCLTCQENDRNSEAAFYCEECSKFFCGNCVELHNTLFKRHELLGRNHISQWPKTNVDELEICQEHTKERLTGFCEDHLELICHVCHLHNHKNCSQVILIADKVKDLDQKGELDHLSVTVDKQRQKLTKKIDYFRKSLMSFRKSYTKSLKEIKALRKKINDSLDLLENSTLKELDKLLATMRTSIQADIKKCTESVQNMTCVQDDWLNVKDKNEVIHFIKYRKCLEQSLKTKTILQGMATTQAMTLTFNPDTTIQKTLATLSGLGQILCQMKQSKSSKSATENMAKRSQMPDSNTVCSQQQQQSDVNKPSELCNTSEVITKKNRERYTVKTKDRNECNISNICETSMGERLITDKSNCKVKLLDKTYKVVAHYDLPGIPLSMCSIDSNLVAVAVDNCEVHFIRVTDGQLIKDRIQKLEHPCLCIAHKGSHLYITSSTALYQYTVDGTLVRKMYEDALDSQTVASCAVSNDGDRIYLANIRSNQLVTLSRDGKVISTLTDPALNWKGYPPGLRVTDSGQVLVCGVGSHAIIEVDKDGRRRVAEVVPKTEDMSSKVTQKDDVKSKICLLQ